MNDYLIDLMYCIIGPLVSLIICVLESISAWIFLGNEFKNIKIFKFVSLNAALDSYALGLTSIFPIIQFLTKHVISIDNKTGSYLLLFTNHYLIICFGSTIKALSEHTSVFIAIYRLIEFNRFRSINKRLRFKWTTVSLIILALVTTFPIYSWNRLILKTNGTSYELQENIRLIWGLNFTLLTKRMRIILNLLTLIFIILSNIYTVLILRGQYVKRRRLYQLSFIYRNKRRIRLNRQDARPSTRLIDSLNKQIRLSLLVGTISLMFSIDMINQSLFHYFIYFKNIDPLSFSHSYIFIHFFICFFHLAYFLCYFCFIPNFRKEFKEFIFKL